jgi:phosphoribosylformylglycinamidine cyclo-ligase
MSEGRQSDYAAAGVDTDQAEAGLGRLVSRIRATWPRSGVGRVLLDVGYYANVIDIGGMGLAITTDGVGSKILIAEMLGKFDTIGIDCVAMNVNDLICVGARPLSLVVYLAVEAADPIIMDEVAKGLCAGAELAGVSIPGGEIAQLPEIVRGVREGSGFDLAATAIGIVPLDRIVVGADVEAGDVLIGIESNGIHSNGLTLARHVLFQQAGLAIDAPMPTDGRTIGEELLRPTYIYVREALEMLDAGLGVKALMHVTGGGFLNLSRVAAPMGFAIDVLPDVPAIFGLIASSGSIEPAEMYRVFNMGVGLCVVVPENGVERAIAIAAAHGKRALVLGRAVPDADRRIEIRPLGLISSENRFVST